MKRMLIILPLFLSMSLIGQGIRARDYVAPGILLFVAGAAEGVMDHLQFHYDGSHPFWQPDISWRNKYKGGDPANGKTFAGKYMVWVTDGWHSAKGLRNGCIVAGIAVKVGEKKKFVQYLKDAAFYYLANRAGFTLTYNLLNK